MWPNPQETMDLVRFTEEIRTGKTFFAQCKDYNVFYSPTPLLQN